MAPQETQCANPTPSTQQGRPPKSAKQTYKRALPEICMGGGMVADKMASSDSEIDKWRVHGLQGLRVSGRQRVVVARKVGESFQRVAAEQTGDEDRGEEDSDDRSKFARLRGSLTR